MFKRIEIEAKNENEALQIACEQLRLSADKITISETNEKKGLFGKNKSSTFIASSEVSLALEGKQYLSDILSTLEIESIMEMRNISNNEIAYKIQSNNNALIIGKNGQTLLSLQKIVKNYLQSFVTQPLIISIDVGDYNERRIRQLEILATKTAKEVAISKVEAKLDNLSSFDRRVIHAKLADWKDVTTISEGTGEDRVLIIKPKKKD